MKRESREPLVVRPFNFGAIGFWLLAQPLGAKAPPTGEAGSLSELVAAILLWEGLQPREPAAGRPRQALLQLSDSRGDAPKTTGRASYYPKQWCLKTVAPPYRATSVEGRLEPPTSHSTKKGALCSLFAYFAISLSCRNCKHSRLKYSVCSACTQWPQRLSRMKRASGQPSRIFIAPPTGLKPSSVPQKPSTGHWISPRRAVMFGIRMVLSTVRGWVSQMA